VYCSQIGAHLPYQSEVSDKSHISMGIFNDLDSIFGINLHYFMICAHISVIVLGFGLFRFLIVNLHISSKVLGEKYED